MTAYISNEIGSNMQELAAFYQLQQQAQELLQQSQSKILAAQMQLNRSHSMHNQQQQPLPSINTKQPAQRSLSDISAYQLSQRESLPTRSPPGLTAPLHKQQMVQQAPSQSQIILAQLPQQPCVALQRRDSVKSEGSLQSMESSSRYKTEMCRPFEETGHCRYGSKCQFAHGINELRGLNRHPRYKTEFCRTFHTSGFCSYGQRCNFIHNEDERRIPPAQQAPVSPGHSTMNPQSPITAPNSSGSSPASSIYGDMSPSHSPNYMLDDPFTSSTSSRLSPAPSLSSFTSDTSNHSMSFPSPPGTPLDSDEFTDAKILSSPIDFGLSFCLNNLNLRQ